MTKSDETLISNKELYELYRNSIELKITMRYNLKQTIRIFDNKKSGYTDLTNPPVEPTYHTRLVTLHKQLGEEIEELKAKRDQLDIAPSIVSYEEHLVNEELRDAEDREAAAEIDRNCTSFAERVKKPDVIRALEALEKAIICDQVGDHVIRSIEIDGIDHKGYWVWDNKPKRKGHWEWGESPITRQKLESVAKSLDKQLTAVAYEYYMTNGKGKKEKK